MNRVLILAAAFVVAAASTAHAEPGARLAASKVVKIYGAGGLGRLEAYQSGLLIDADGRVLTANTLVLDQGEVTVVLDNGDRYSGEVLGADPIADIALIKIDPAGAALPAFDLRNAANAESGDAVFALANVFGIASGAEPVSVMRGVVSTRAPLRALRGPRSRFTGDVYILDAVTSNPGAAGGAVVDHRGRIVGMLGRELQSRVTGAWLSYAIPADELRSTAARILAGEASAAATRRRGDPSNVRLLPRYGFALAPNIVPRTPPYVDYVRPDSPAARAGLMPDDLVVSIDGLITGSADELRRLVATRGGGGDLELLVERGGDLVEIRITAPEDRRE